MNVNCVVHTKTLHNRVPCILCYIRVYSVYSPQLFSVFRLNQFSAGHSSVLFSRKILSLYSYNSVIMAINNKIVCGCIRPPLVNNFHL